VAWRVVDLPASGQISNVSKLVLRWTAGMPDHGRQVMLPDPFDKLLEYAKLQLERERVKLERKTLHARKRKQRAPPDAEPKAERGYLPQTRAHRTYTGFRTSMLEYEQAVREVVGKDGKVTHEAINVDSGGPSPKTQRRTMIRYGLRYDTDWPPSTWPSVPPNGRP